MKNKLGFFVLLIFLFESRITYSQYSSTQDNKPNQIYGTLKGKVLDKNSNQAIEFANITILKAKDSSLVTGSVTNKQGLFYIENLPMGKFVIKIKFIGYNLKKIQCLINPQKHEIDLDIIELESSDANLKEITVKAQKDMVSYNIDRKVFNVDRNIAAAGGSALDLMQNIPSISVDVNGSVSLRGSENVTILIDGRPSGLTSLDQIPASMIQNIEIITNPSAKFDPDGMSGIINITMKRKDSKGFNGQLTIGLGSGNKYNGGINLNVRREKINLTFNYDYRHFAMDGVLSSLNQRMYIPNIKDTSSSQQTNIKREGSFHNFKIGTDWYINQKNTFSISGLLNTRRFIAEDTTKNQYFSLPNLLNLYDEQQIGTIMQMNNRGYEFTSTYKKTFDKKGTELSFDGFASISNADNSNLSLQKNLIKHQTPVNQAINTLTQTDNLNNTFTLQADFTLPLEAGKFETGLKSTLKTTDIDNQNKNHNYLTNKNDLIAKLSNHFEYDEQFNAAYGSLAKGFGKFKYQIGLRLEQSETNAKILNENINYHKKYFDFFPTIHLQYQFSENNTLQLNYTKRINRPNSRILNPAINNSDSLNISKGNPLIDPEYAHAYELGHSIVLGKTSLTSTIFYRKTLGLMSRVTNISKGIKESTYINLNNSTSYGIELVVNQDLTKWWKVSANYSYFNTSIEGKDISGQNQSDSWTLKGNSNMNLPLGVDLQLSFNYRSSAVTAGSGGGRGWDMGSTGKTAEIYWLDAGIKKDFMKNKLSITLRISDFLKSQIFLTENFGLNFNSTNDRKMSTRIIFFGLTYKLNDFKRQRDRQREESEDGQSGI